MDKFFDYLISKGVATTSDLRTSQMRLSSAMMEMVSGYEVDAGKTLSSSIESSTYTGTVFVENLHFVSLCSHHLLPFFGSVSIAYIPKGRIAGFSRFADLVDALSKRLQTQENLTQEIFNEVNNSLSPKGALVCIKARHFCLSARNNRSCETVIRTSQESGDKIDVSW